MRKNLEDMLNKLNRAEEDIGKTELEGEEMDRILALTLQKIKKEKEEKPSGSAGKRLKRVAAASIVAALAFSTVVYAGTAMHWNEKFVRFFGLYGNEQTHNAPGMQIGQSVTDNGVTITAEQITGDNYGFYILLNVKGGGEIFGEACFKELNVNIEGVKSYQCSDLKTMGMEGDVASYIMNIRTPEQVIGKKISIEFIDYGYETFGEYPRFHMLKEGKWRLAWTLDYEDQLTTVKVNKDINIYGGTATFKEVSISPLSVTAYLTNEKNFKTYIGNGEQINDSLKVLLMDGTLINSEYMDSSDIIQDVTMVSMSFNRVVNLNEIESITFAGVTVPITDNPNAPSRVTYDNKNLGFRVEIPKELYDMTTMQVSEGYYDNDLRAEAKRVDFIGTIEGEKMTMFSVNAFKMDPISKDELDNRNPMMVYMTYKNGYLYTMSYGEIQTDKQMELFPDILNKYTAKIMNWVTVYGIGKK